MVTRAEAIRAAARVFVEAQIARDSLTPRAAAEAAYYPGHRLGSVEAIEALIISQRAEAARLATAPLLLVRSMTERAS